MEVKIVLGHTFGDEGKGVTVQWLCKKAIEEGKKPLVVRFSGGPQAAHTIFNGGTEHICSSFGSGVLLGVPTVYTSNVYVDPICLMNERKVLIDKGIENPTVYLNSNRIITPYDVLAGRASKRVRKDGTCGKGVFTTFDRYNHCASVRTLVGLTDPEHHLDWASSYYNSPRIKEYDDMFKKAMLEIRTDLPLYQLGVMNGVDVLILEGTQGLLLDMDNGFYPNVTPSKVGLNGVPEPYLKDAEVYLVTRTYTTRHGNGYEPKPHGFCDLSEKYETNVNNEFQGEFKTGILEFELLNRAYERHCIDNYVKKHNMSVNLVITHMDVCQEDKHYNFGFIDKVGQRHACIGMNKMFGKEEIGRLFTSNLIYAPDHIYYNDRVESTIKQLR